MVTREQNEKRIQRIALQVRERHCLRTYGMSLNQVMQMLAEQDGRCAICRIRINYDRTWTQQLNIDHDHRTGKVRGLLCPSCNIQLEQDRPFCKEAVAYLQKNNQYVPEKNMTEDELATRLEVIWSELQEFDNEIARLKELMAPLFEEQQVLLEKRHFHKWQCQKPTVT